jgi:HTH-type transcriptional regulator / antitoxin HigA
MGTEAARPWPDIAIPPGETLAETLDERGISQADLARRMDRPVQAINEIVRGAKEITPETAIQLERVVGVPAHVWVRLEADYQYVRARLVDQERLKDEIALARRYPYGAMAKVGWVAKTERPVERVTALLGFFGVSSLRNVATAYETGWRRARTRGGCPEALVAWLRRGELIGHTVKTMLFDEARLRRALPELRGFTIEPPPTFESRLISVLANCGVALALVPRLLRTGATGATRWLSPEKVLVQMSLCYPWEDVFWFSLFHALGHVLLHRRRDVFIEMDHAPEDDRERAADTFATNTLIPVDQCRAFLRSGAFRTKRGVMAFAREIGVAPSIVLGRLRHDGYVPHSYLPSLRRQFRWATRAA